MIAKSIIDKAVVAAFEMHEKQQREQFGGDYPVRLSTWQVKSIIGGRYTNPQVRASCRRLLERGLLKKDPHYSCANLLFWRWK